MNAFSKRRRELADWSMIAIFVLAVFVVMRLMSGLLAPMIAAVIVGALLSRVVDRLAKIGVPPPIAAIGVVALTGLVIVFFVGLLLGPLITFIGQAPDMLMNLEDAVAPVVQPFQSMRQSLTSLFGAQSNSGQMLMETGMSGLSAIFGGVTPALGEFGVFFVTLAFFIAGRQSLRRRVIMTWTQREQRFSALRIINAVEDSLVRYFSAAASIYAGVGLITALITWGSGLSKPVLWGVLTFLASFVPYFGATVVTLALAAGGLAAHHQLGLGLAPAAGFLLVHLVSENAVIPALLGRRLEINPFVVFISIVFWSWMWGPIGALLATPILLIFGTIKDEFSVSGPNLPS